MGYSQPKIASVTNFREQIWLHKQLAFLKTNKVMKRFFFSDNFKLSLLSFKGTREGKLFAQSNQIKRRNLVIPNFKKIIMKAGHSVLMFPKFHCEFSFIENLWGRMKVYLRRNCTCSFTALQETILRAVQSVPLAVIRRYAQRCDRFIDAYRVKDSNGKGLAPEQVARGVKMFKSHRCIPAGAAALFPERLQ